jgi:hypothetical protein
MLANLFNKENIIVILILVLLIQNYMLHDFQSHNIEPAVKYSLDNAKEIQELKKEIIILKKMVSTLSDKKIDKIKEVIARKKTTLNKFEEDIIRLENDQLKLQKSQKKEKKLAMENGNSDRFLQIMKDYESTEVQLRDVQTKVSVLTTEIINLTKQLETEIVKNS